MPPPPGQTDLEALAERALAHVEGEGQATAWWERRAGYQGGALSVTDAVRVEVAAVGDAGTGLLETNRTDEDGLRAAATGARRLAGGLHAGRLPEPEPGRAHDGYDPDAAGLDAVRAAEVVAALPPSAVWDAGAARIAIASTRGVRAYEQRSFASLTLGMIGQRHAFVRAAATGPGGLDPAALTADAVGFAGTAAADAEPAPGERAVVLGPWAVAALLEQAAWAFGGASGSRFAAALGTRLVAPCINLSDSPRFERTLQRSFDAEGAPVKPTPLIQDGVAHRVVHDATSAAAAGVSTTGHASAPGGAHFPHPRNLVLVGGGAADAAELAACLDEGLLITSLLPRGQGFRAHGVRAISGGELGSPVGDLTVWADTFDVLAAADALTGRQWLIGELVPRSARAVSGTVAPALRARGGVHVLPD